MARYEVPDSVVPRPLIGESKLTASSAIKFNYTASPFSFSVYRTDSEEILFSTASHPLIFEPQYIRVKTNLPENPNIYGLGEHTDTFRLPTNNYTRTMWSRDAYGVPAGTNLYGNHPIYFGEPPSVHPPPIPLTTPQSTEPLALMVFSYLIPMAWTSKSTRTRTQISPL